MNVVALVLAAAVAAGAGSGGGPVERPLTLARCVATWNAAPNASNRRLVARLDYRVGVVRYAGANKAGQEQCAALFRLRRRGPWILFASVLGADGQNRWERGGQRGSRWRADSPTGRWSTSPNVLVRPDGSVVLRRG